jgi:putative addiction module killer protein
VIREVLRYQLPNGKQPFTVWLHAITDLKAKSRILARLERISSGNFGDIKLVHTGIWELRFHFGPGYRIYFGLDGPMLVLLLCAGDKSTQEHDIQLARQYWMDYLQRRT